VVSPQADTPAVFVPAQAPGDNISVAPAAPPRSPELPLEFCNVNWGISYDFAPSALATEAGDDPVNVTPVVLFARTAQLATTPVAVANTSA